MSDQRRAQRRGAGDRRSRGQASSGRRGAGARLLLLLLLSSPVLSKVWTRHVVCHAVRVLIAHSSSVFSCAVEGTPTVTAAERRILPAQRSTPRGECASGATSGSCRGSTVGQCALALLMHALCSSCCRCQIDSDSLHRRSPLCARRYVCEHQRLNAFWDHGVTPLVVAGEEPFR